jgi:hypothetical protein
MRIVNSISSVSREAASDILKKFNSSQIENIKEITEKIIDYYSNKVFMLGYWAVIKNNNNTDPSNKVVRNLAGEKLYESIFIAKKFILLESYVTISYKKEEKLVQKELIKEIAEIINLYLKRIFIAGYSVRQEENVENDEREVIKHLGSISFESRDAALNIFKRFDSSQVEKTKESIEKIVDYCVNKIFMLGYLIGTKDNNNTDFGDEVVKNLACKKLYESIFNTKKSILIDTYNKILSGREEGRAQGELIEEIAEKMNFYLKFIFVTGCMAGSEENIKNNDKNKALGASI